MLSNNALTLEQVKVVVYFLGFLVEDSDSKIYGNRYMLDEVFGTNCHPLKNIPVCHESKSALDLLSRLTFVITHLSFSGRSRSSSH